ncbi:MAG: hypothetical protein U0136_04290 [Bdellovibrionota bacterium]
MTAIFDEQPAGAPLTVERVLGDYRLDSGKYSGKPLIQIWAEDRNYLLWSANLAKNPCTYPPPRLKVELIKIANLIESGEHEKAVELYRDLKHWIDLTENGVGLSELPRPSREECMAIISSCTILGGHADLDGIYSLAIAMHAGGALEHGRMKGAFARLRLFRYGFRQLLDYTNAIGADKDDTVVVIDFSAHPQAALNLDHHTTSLCYWDLGSPLPVGVYEPSMPSCPRLLATFCGLKLDEDLLCGCDMVDGALYSSVEQTTDFTNPYVALEHCLSLDVSDTIAKKVALLLAEHALDPYAVLDQPSWKSRVDLLKHELEEQRMFWARSNRIHFHGDLISIADSRLAPYSPSRFRYLPFENDRVRGLPYLITVRPAGYSKVNLSVSRNPFFAKPEFYVENPINLGALAKSMGKGGGRKEVSSLTLDVHQLSGAIDQVVAAIELSVQVK